MGGKTQEVHANIHDFIQNLIVQRKKGKKEKETIEHHHITNFKALSIEDLNEALL